MGSRNSVQPAASAYTGLQESAEPQSPSTLAGHRRNSVHDMRSTIRAHEDKHLPYQMTVFDMYHHWVVEGMVAFLIIINFFTQCLKRMIDPTKQKHRVTWDKLNVIFNIAFLAELLFNLYGYGYSDITKFLKSKWNQFDIVVVTLGVLDLAQFNYPRQLRLLRMLRAFRIFRLFGRVESLKKILMSLINAMPGVMQSFVIVVIMICIYAVLAVDLFRGALCDDSKLTTPNQRDVAMTPRGRCFGEDYYGDFTVSFYTMFQILTGESWSEAAVRPLLEAYSDDPVSKVFVMAFFISFILINSFVLLNVVVAVLLDGMNTASEEQPKPKSTAVQLHELREIEDARPLTPAEVQKMQNFKAQLALEEKQTLTTEEEGQLERFQKAAANEGPESEDKKLNDKLDEVLKQVKRLQDTRQS